MSALPQNERFKNALDLLSRGVVERVIPGAQLGVSHRGEIVCDVAIGSFTYEENSVAVTPATVYDLASLSKVISTTSMAMKLYEAGKLDLDEPVVNLLPEFSASEDIRHSYITTRMLLAHTSGLPGYAKLYEMCFLPAEIKDAIYKMPLAADPGKKVEYSDIGFILLGFILQRISGEPLDIFCKREIFSPLKMEHTCFKPSVDWKPNIPPTEQEMHYRRRMLQGEVHDENASAVGGIAGHAGLFAPTADVTRFALSMLGFGTQVFQTQTVEYFTSRNSAKKVSPTDNTRALGWDTPSQLSASGKYFSNRSFGHLGFTGTSLWIDAEKQISVTLLSNRTWPDRSERTSAGIKRLRPLVHDAVMEILQ
jgi:CubicO group peptidase (beta-lactamase class C family)